MKPVTLILVSLAAVVGSPAIARAAACCGGASAAPNVITGDDRLQFTAALGMSQVIGDAPAEGLPVFRSAQDQEAAETLRMDGALLLSDRWQGAFSLPVVRRTHRTAGLDETSQGLGDISLGAAFEALPEWGYSAWKPHAFVFSQVTLPTGSSIYDTEKNLATDANGRGFFSASVGALALKSWGNWDVSCMAELHRALPRSFDSQGGEALRVNPGWGATASLGAGYSLGNWRLGGAISPQYEEPITTSGLVSSAASYQTSWSTSAQLSWMPTSAWSGSLLYSDQTILGPAVNVALSRSVSLVLQKRWER